MLVTRNGELITDEGEPGRLRDNRYFPSITAGMEKEMVEIVPVELD